MLSKSSSSGSGGDPVESQQVETAKSQEQVMAARRGSGAGTTFCLSATCLALVLVAASASLSESRYLPTRSDDSQLETLKDILANILSEEAGERQRERELQLARSARFFAGPNYGARLLAHQRAAHLTGSGGAAGNGRPPAERTMLDAAFIQRRAAELTAPYGSLPGADLRDFASVVDRQQADGSQGFLKLQNREADGR